MRPTPRSLVAALMLSALAASPVLAQAQDTGGSGQTISQGPLTAWCDPGQMLLSGGYDLQGAEPPSPPATDEATPADTPPVVTVAASHPTFRFDGEGNIRNSAGPRCRTPLSARPAH